MLLKRIKVPKLETKDLWLRGWTKKDAADLFEYAQDPLIGPPAGWAPHKRLEHSMIAIEDGYRTVMAWALEEKATGKVIGSIMLTKDVYRPDINSHEMGYTLARSRWGRGYMSQAADRILEYAFNTLNAEVVMLRIAQSNERSRRLADRKGFVYEGMLRHAYKMYNGKVREVCCYSMLREEYTAKNKS